MYDLLIKSGTVIDPGQGLHDSLDVAVNDGKIAAVAHSISSHGATHVVDASNKIVVPGLIDLHCHVYDGFLRSGVDPDLAGVRQGVTTVADGGSAGQAIFGGFPKFIVPNARTTVFCFLNLASLGLAVSHEIDSWDAIDSAATENTIESNRDVVKGIKLFWVGILASTHGSELMKLAKSLLAKYRLPLLMHIGDNSKRMPVPRAEECLSFMESGDILSHIFTSQPGGILDPNGKVLPDVKAAVERGVFLDVAHGRFNFSFEVAKRVIDQGVLPATISSDVSSLSVRGPAYGMTMTMSKLLAIGLGLERVIAMGTIIPARALGIERSKGSLRPGMDADISVLEITPGAWDLEDSDCQRIRATKLLTPRMTVKLGQLISADSVIQPRAIS